MTNITIIDDVELDRFVDGETGPDEERDLLARLDRVEDGWRRLGLAFVEARTWGREMLPALPPPSTLASDVTPAEPRSAADADSLAAEPAPVRRRAPWAWTALAVAIAWMLGLGTARLLVPAASNTAQPMADKRTPPADAERIVGVPGREGAIPPRVVPRIESREPVVPVLAEDQISIPVVSDMAALENWSNLDRPDLPDDVLRLLQQTGHELEERRDLIRVPLEDGREAYVPVGRYTVRRVHFQ